MGSKIVKNEIGRNLRSDSGTSEINVTLGLQRTKESLECFIESIYPDNCPDNVKSQIKKKLLVMLYADSTQNKKSVRDIDSIGATFQNSYTYFYFIYEITKENKINIAYKLIIGKFNIQKAITQEYKGKQLVKETTESLGPEETKRIIEQYLDINEEKKLYQCLEENKKNMISD